MTSPATLLALAEKVEADGWADQRLSAIYYAIDAIACEYSDTVLGCLNDALKAVELADGYIEKRQREEAE